MSPENRKKKKDDWNYLKQTLRSNNMMNGGDPEVNEQVDSNLISFHEKADELVEMEEELRNKHLEYLKEAAKLLTEEG